MSNIAPYHLPQISAPINYILNKLDKEGVTYEILDINPKILKPNQALVFSDIVSKINSENINPIWISKDNEILDGHHRYLKSIMNKKSIKCVKIGLNNKDAIRILNKIQDIYDYEKQQQIEEVVMQDAINSDDGDISTNEFLSMLESAEMPKGNGSKIIAYRQKPITENSIVGNFFLLEPIEGYDKYEIDFDNLLDTDDLGVEFGDRNPIDVLANTWFPNVDFKKLNAPFVHSPIDLKNRAIAEKANQLGYDGIKYGNKLIQGLK